MRESERLRNLAQEARNNGHEEAAANYEVAARMALIDEKKADLNFSWIAAE